MFVVFLIRMTTKIESNLGSMLNYNALNRRHQSSDRFDIIPTRWITKPKI